MAQERGGRFGERRWAPAVEVRTGLSTAGRTRHLVDGDDLLLLLGGRHVAVHCRGHVDTVPPALFCVTEPGEVITLDFPALTPFRVLYVKPGLLARALLSRGGLDGGVPDGQRVVWVIAGHHVCTPGEDVPGDMDLGWMIDQTVSVFGCRVRRVVEEPVTHPVVQRVRNHLRAEYARKVKVDELASMAGMCRFALVRAFTREVGMPPHAYQTHLRIARARQMIEAGRPLSDVSVAVGFTDQSHLSRHFRRLIGVTPGLYARLSSTKVDPEVLASRATAHPTYRQPPHALLQQGRAHRPARMVS